MERNLTIEFKDESKREGTKNIVITCLIDSVSEDKNIMIEFWDPQRDYHFCKPIETEISEWESISKSGSLPKEDVDELKSKISYWRRYSNKRVLMNIDDFWNTFNAKKCTYWDREDIPRPTLQNEKEFYKKWRDLFANKSLSVSDTSQEVGNCKTIFCHTSEKS